jgi:hypothetical protein
MIPYKLDFAFERLIRTGPSMERTLLRIYTGSDISENEARSLWERIADHKWYVSERLSRDVGFHVAAVDYVEHFYEPYGADASESRLTAIWKNIWLKTRSIAKSYFETKGQTASL